MADEIIRLDYSAEDIGDNIDEVREARGEYDSLDERLDEIEGGGPSPSSDTPAMDGTGAAGTADTYARGDHVHPTDTSRQAAIDSSHPIASECVSPMTGYSKSSSSTPGDINTNDTLNAAIGKLEKRTELNENNILLNTQNGVKNLFNLTKASGTNNTVVFTVNSDKTVTITGTASPSNSVFNLDDWTCTKAGTYVVSGAPSGGSWAPSPNTYRIRVAVNGTWKGDEVGNGFALTLAVGDVINLQINTSTSYTANNLIFKPMICEKSLYDVSPTYQPYALSNAELTAAIQALQAQLANQ